MDLKAKLERARQMDVDALSTEDVAERMRLVMAGYETMTALVTLTGLFRARKNIGDAPWSSVKDLWYPPASKVGRGRFNEAGKSVFYACTPWAGAIIEVRPQPGDLITFLVVRPREQFVTLNNAHIGLERLNTPEFGKRQRSHVLRRNPEFQALLAKRGLTRKWLLIDNFLSGMATTLFPPGKEENKYKITNVISSQLFKIPGVQGLIYPSVANNLKCINFCLLPRVADEFFVPTEAWMIRIEEKTFQPSSGFDNYRFSFKRKSEDISADGRISWGGELRNVRPEDTPNFASYSPLMAV